MWQGNEAEGYHTRSLTPQLRCYLEYLIRHQIAVAEMVVRGDRHAIAQPSGDERSLEVGLAFIAAVGVIGAGGDGRAVFAPGGAILAHTLERNNGLAIDFGRDQSPDGVSYVV